MLHFVFFRSFLIPSLLPPCTSILPVTRSRLLIYTLTHLLPPSSTRICTYTPPCRPTLLLPTPTRAYTPTLSLPPHLLLTLGISLKTQELYLLVFVCRYLDLFTNFLSMYNTVMKILYIFTAAAIVYMIRFREPWSITYKKEEDSFKHWKFVVAPCAVLAFLICDNRWSPMEVLWTFSIYCEAVAIMPQVVILTRYGDVENLTAHYVFSLGAYRALYLVNWIYRYNTEPYYRAWIVWGAGIVQTALYLDFFYYYAKRCASGGGGDVCLGERESRSGAERENDGSERNTHTRC